MLPDGCLLKQNPDDVTDNPVVGSTPHLITISHASLLIWFNLFRAPQMTCNEPWRAGIVVSGAPPRVYHLSGRSVARR